MNILIRELLAGDQASSIDFDSSFTVDSELVLSIEGQQVSYTVKKIPSNMKCYSDEQFEEASDVDFSAYIDNPDQIIYLAFAGNQAVGEIILKRNWNKYAYVEDIKVDKSYRRYGVGRKLIDQAERWAKAGGMPGIMLETQNNNVSACKFYESCGFVIGGFDFHVYQGLDKQSNEIAIFWYLMFE
ncbi:GNAT family N-acetyltransferase [Paenibacillus sp. SYP-B3998]|uniref:GNAT family N-acetyltransferase n=1 Tax=Paenibacillus sp. SYP-B3998 TaxID=2678564 RepID=A0A6G3ZU38_9BACL|nr:GNAT family N-acetyltransferase [Paenibacillus sp. SYP-B3998]NEW05723.1 GNAT family N-acetyltransferase [Paenibacillus sp. SYP-B3998]